ncbi:MAG: type II CAAX endopeptidase family protein [Chloroflexota bacterium]
MTLPSQPRISTWIKRLFITKDEPRLRAGWRLIVHAFFLLVAVMLFTSLVSLILTGLSSSAQVMETLNSSQIAMAFSTIVSLGAITLSVYLARLYIDRRSFASLGITWNQQSFGDLLFGFVLPGVLMGAIYFIEKAVGWLQPQSLTYQNQPFLMLLGNLALWLVFFLAVGWSEELLSRGYWMQNLIEGLNMPAAVILSSLFFGLLHLSNPNITANAIIGLTLSGVFFAYSYLRTRNLWLPIGLHVGWNFFEGVIFGFPVSGISTYSLIQSHFSGPTLWTGGAFGPEGGLILLPTLAAGMLLIHLYTREPVEAEK